MKTKTTLMLLAICLLQSITAQTPSGSTLSTIEPDQNKDEQKAVEFFLQHHPNYSQANYDEFISSWRNTAKTNLNSLNQKNSLPSPSSPMAACTNVDFENGNLNGWTASTGFNPLYASSGCCPSPGGAQLITSGTGVDPCGGFPVVCPGGNFSLMLGDNQTGGHADRIEQTFQVSSANTNYSYKYAVVLQDPGHITSEQPYFEIDMLDANGNPIPCTYYQVSAGQNIPGFLNSQNCPSVIYKPWTTVSVDLSTYVGQTVTIRFTAYDCALGGHFGYAYIDGSCSPLGIQQSNVLCSNSFTNLCAPAGFATYVWNGPGVNNVSGQCITVTNGGIYNVQMTSVTGCSSPLVNYAVNVTPAPVANFSVTNNNGCNSFISFTNNSSGGFYSSYWNFGDGDTSTANSPSHTYAAYGTYTVSLVVHSLNGCSDTATNVVTINPPPVPGMSFTGICEGTPFQFTGTVNGTQQNTQWLWNFGNNNISTLQNPVYTFPSWGAFPVTLSVTNNGCTTIITQNVSVKPKPVVTITSGAVCLGSTTTFTNTSSVALGNINSWAWDFNNDGIIDNTTQNPVTTYTSSGTYTVVLTAVSSYGCVSQNTTQSVVYGLPTSSFTTQNSCLHTPSVFVNNSAAPTGASINQFTWTFGNGNTSSAQQPQYTYPTAGTYLVVLVTTTNQGCTAISTNPVTVFPTPVVNFSSNPVCANQTMPFTNQSSISTGTITAWRWDFNNDGIVDATTANPSYVFTAGGNYNSKLTAVSNNSCADSILKPTSVYFNPIANFNAASVCLGQSVQFTDASTNQNGYLTVWDWDFTSDGIIDNLSQNTSNTYTTAGLFLVTLQVQNSFGCINVIKKPVRVNPTPVVDISVTHQSGCEGDMCVGMINNSTITGGSVANWLWNFGDNTTSGQNSPAHCFHAGTFTVSLTAVSDSGCSASQTMPGSITVYPKPQAGFGFSNTDLDVLNNQTEIVDASHGATSYIYFISDGTIVTGHSSFNYTFTNENPDTYTVIQVVTNSFGCRDTAINVIEVKPAFTFYIPNAFSPNGDGTNDVFKGTGIGIKTYTIWIFDRWGNLVFTSNDLEKGWDGTWNGKGGDVSLQDVFVWKVELRDENDKYHGYDGTVSLIK